MIPSVAKLLINPRLFVLLPQEDFFFFKGALFKPPVAYDMVCRLYFQIGN